MASESRLEEESQCYQNRIFSEKDQALPVDSTASNPANADKEDMGLDSSIRSRDNKMSHFLDRIRIKNQSVRECLAEFIGTFILMVFGNGSVAQATLSYGASGNYLTIYWGYGLGVAMGVYVAAGVSGAHLNPAVSLAQCVIGRFPWNKLSLYILSQFFGAFLSGAVVFGIYYDAINAYDGGNRHIYGVNATAGIFATYPQEYLTLTGALFDQIFGTALLLCGILAINDKRNNKPPSGLEPLMVGLLVFAIGNTYGTNCGYAINPARDFGPRLFTCIAGWGPGVFLTPSGEHWWWVPILGPLIGGILGALAYIGTVELHWPDTNKDRENMNDFPVGGDIQSSMKLVENREDNKYVQAMEKL